MTNVISVEYEINSQNWRDGQFSIPRKVADILGVDPESEVLVEVTTSKGTKSFVVTVKSGFEIYSIKDHVCAGELIRVKISLAPIYVE